MKQALVDAIDARWESRGEALRYARATLTDRGVTERLPRSVPQLAERFPDLAAEMVDDDAHRIEPGTLKAR
jgi:hypothetical protein